MLKSVVVSAFACALILAAPAHADEVEAAIEAANAKMVADYAASSGDPRMIVSDRNATRSSLSRMRRGFRRPLAARR